MIGGDTERISQSGKLLGAQGNGLALPIADHFLGNPKLLGDDLAGSREVVAYGVKDVRRVAVAN